MSDSTKTEALNKLRLCSGDLCLKCLSELLSVTSEFSIIGEVGKIASQNPDLLDCLVKIIREHGQSNSIGRVAFFSVFNGTGPVGFVALRKAWQADPKKIYLHMCMLDMLGGGWIDNEEKQQQMEQLAEEEIPIWIEELSRPDTSERGNVAWMLGVLASYAPLSKEKARRALTPLLNDSSEWVHSLAERGLNAANYERKRF